jgi:adenylate kinase family enzyme
MQRIIIIEGPQGTGKTTLSNFLRENIPSSNLYRLSGQKDKTNEGKKLSIKMYNALFKYMSDMESVPMDLIFDRTFVTEHIYATLGYKDYSFKSEYLIYLERLLNLNYEIYYFNLYLDETKTFQKRLEREHHMYQSFSVKNSIEQQEQYKIVSDELKKTKIKVYDLCMDDFTLAYETVCKELKIERRII